jgi:RbsD / FucU transport protein family
MRLNTGATAWERILEEKLLAFGHRNWIVVADAAYPLQSRPGIETVVSGTGHVEVLKAIVASLQSARHIRPRIYGDRELAFVTEPDAPGVDEFRRLLQTILAGFERMLIPHEELIGRLDHAAAMYNVLIIKTTLLVPYTTMFFELECGYWSDAAERRLRDAMSAVVSA